MTKHRDLFTARQLVALTTFRDLVPDARERIVADGGDIEYSGALATHLAFLVSKLADIASLLCRWEPVAQCPRGVFSRQAIPMVWDFAEGNPFGESSGSWGVLVSNQRRSLRSPFLSVATVGTVNVSNLDATAAVDALEGVLICTDPPYYDNVPYAGLSDFFYVWLRRGLADVHPNLFSTLLTPKARELVADQFRFGGSRAAARRFFEDGMTRFFTRACGAIQT